MKGDIPIFHDDQHGTAVITLAGLTNALKVVGKKKEEEVKAPACSCNGACETYEAESVENTCCEGAKEGVCCIKILGSGCKNCHALLENTQAALKNMGLSIEPETAV